MIHARHVIWDWNGTLLNDFPAVFAATNYAFGSLGLPEVTEHQYRASFHRPVRSFYHRLIGRDISDAEWHHLDKTFHEAYARFLPDCELATGAEHALQLVLRLGLSQSLLSMYTHDALMGLIDDFNLAQYFGRVDGLRDPGASGGAKAPYLEAHLQNLGVAPREAVMVGDALDDASAASVADCSCILFAGGWHHPQDLLAAGVPVVEMLPEIARHLAPLKLTDALP